MPPKVPMAVLRGVEMTISWIVLMTCSFRACQLNCNGRGSQAKLLCKSALFSISTYRFFPFSLLSKESQAWHSCPPRPHTKTTMLFHHPLDLYPPLPPY